MIWGEEEECFRLSARAPDGLRFRGHVRVCAYVHELGYHGLVRPSSRHSSPLVLCERVIVDTLATVASTLSSMKGVSSVPKS